MVKSKTFGKDLRLVAILAHKDGKSTETIFNNLQKTASESTINRWIPQYKTSGQIQAKKVPGRQTIRTKVFKEKVIQNST